MGTPWRHLPTLPKINFFQYKNARFQTFVSESQKVPIINAISTQTISTRYYITKIRFKWKHQQKKSENKLKSRKYKFRFIKHHFLLPREIGTYF